MTLEMTEYRIDPQDRIIQVSSSWNTFALQNEGESCLSAQIHGKPIWNYIHGDMTRMWFHSLLAYVRLRPEPIERPYRCDSPEIKRYMNMVVIPQDNGDILLQHHFLRIEPRANPIHFQVPQSRIHSDYQKRCSICGRVQQDGVWMEIENADSSRMNRGNVLHVFYGVCESCQRLLPG